MIKNTEYQAFRRAWFADPRGLRFGQDFYWRYRHIAAVEKLDRDHNIFFDTDVNRVDSIIAATPNLINWEE